MSAKKTKRENFKTKNKKIKVLCYNTNLFKTFQEIVAFRQPMPLHEALKIIKKRQRIILPIETVKQYQKKLAILQESINIVS